MNRADLHRLVDELPEASVDVVAVYLERAKDPGIARTGVAEWDDEAYTADQRRADLAALEEPAIPWDRAKRDLGEIPD